MRINPSHEPIFPNSTTVVNISVESSTSHRQTIRKVKNEKGEGGKEKGILKKGRGKEKINDLTGESKISTPKGRNRRDPVSFMSIIDRTNGFLLRKVPQGNPSTKQITNINSNTTQREEETGGRNKVGSGESKQTRIEKE